MKKIVLILLAVVALAACEKPEEQTVFNGISFVDANGNVIGVPNSPILRDEVFTIKYDISWGGSNYMSLHLSANNTLESNQDYFIINQKYPNMTYSSIDCMIRSDNRLICSRENNFAGAGEDITQILSDSASNDGSRPYIIGLPCLDLAGDNCDAYSKQFVVSPNGGV